MRVCTKCGESKPHDAFHFNKRQNAPYRHCIQCHRALVRAGYLRNREVRSAQIKAYAKSHPEKFRQSSAAWKARNQEHVKAYAEKTRAAKSEYHRKWYAENLEDKRAKNRKWAKDNPAKHLAICAQRRAAKLSACPQWADLKVIDEIYAEANRLTRETGIKHEVDHVIPLQGKTVCGLHVETNLQILVAAENRSKGARFEYGRS
jgi:hypothetical protein